MIFIKHNFCSTSLNNLAGTRATHHQFFFGNATRLLLFEAAAQYAAAAGKAGDARLRGAARDNRPSWPGEYASLPLSERQIHFFLGRHLVLYEFRPELSLIGT